MSAAVTKFEPQEALLPVPAAPRSTMDMVQEAVMRGASIELVEKLMGLHERWETAQARKAFYDAKAAFKADAPKIVKDKENLQYKSKYTTIGNLVTNVNASLSKHGLDASWDIEQGEKIKVTCILTHRLGHQEKVSMVAPPDNSGAKNPIQQIKSTTTYLKVATFEAVTGIASNEANADDDGNSAYGDGPISDAQVQELINLADDALVDKRRFCEWMKVDSFADLRVSQLDKAKRGIEAKRKKPANA